MWGVITHAWININGCLTKPLLKVGWMSNYIPLFYMDVITYSCPNPDDGSDDLHYDDVIMGTIVSQITSLTIVYSTVYSDADQRKHQSSASLVTFVWGIHRGPVNSPNKWPVTRKMFPFDDVIMNDFPHSVTKPLPRPILNYCQGDFDEQHKVKIWSEWKNPFNQKWDEMAPENIGHFFFRPQHFKRVGQRSNFLAQAMLS